MLNITVTGTALSTYYLADPALFLREQHARIGAEATDDLRHARKELRRLAADIDETTPLGQARARILGWLACFGWRFVSRANGLDEPLPGCDDAEVERAWVLVTPPGQHLDASPTGRRAGKLRPQRQAEVCVRGGTLPAVLVTNGTELRVIRRDPGLGGEANYLAIDLAGLAELGDDYEWKVIWALLRPEAFTPDHTGATLWDTVEQASLQAATRVSENLSGGVRIAIAAIANGALADLRRRGVPDPSARDLFADVLRIAYRLLFVSYAEDRGLLPIGTPVYDSGYSLRRLRVEITDPGTVWEPDSGHLWQALRAQWGLLREGADAGELKITGFNGGLFDIEQCPILDHPNLTVGDTFVRTAIDALAFTQPTRSINRRDTVGRRPINYRELGVEQLGSVYEGLLAYEPHIAESPKAVVRVGRGQSAIEQVINSDQVPQNAEILDELPTGTFYQFGATGERKGSGSYYTPRALAHFVVVETLRPLVENATPEQILNLRVCDPAMGSGAFLVPAVHQLTEAYGEALARAGEDIDHKLDDAERAAYRRLIVERCIYGVDLNPMAVDLAKVSLWLATAASGKPLSFLDAHLRCGNSVIGASIATWEGVPLPAQSNRDSGPSLSEYQESLFDIDEPDLTTIINVRRALAEAPSEDRLHVRAKEKRFARLIKGDDFTRLRALGDWWVAPFFLPEFARHASGWRQGRIQIAHNQPSMYPTVADLRHRVAAYIREEIRPFHWEIEFPEVFFDASGTWRPDAGFDAIIGNPPWEGILFKSAEFYGRFDPKYSLLKRGDERAEHEAQLSEREDVKDARVGDERKLNGTKRFIKESGVYRMLYSHGIAFNYYRVFLERELALLAPHGRIGVTIDSGVAAGAATADHRRELFDHCDVDWFVLCDNINGIFPIHRSEQFLLLVAKKGGSTDPLRFTSGVSTVEHLLDLETRTLPIARATLAALDPENLSVPDIRDPALLDLITVLYGNRPLFLDPMAVGGWSIQWGREFNIKDDRAYFAADGSGAPLREGKHIHQFVHNFSEPTYFLREPEGETALLKRAMKRAQLRGDPRQRRRRRGERVLADENMRSGGLESPFDQYRICFREVARATDERTLIAAVLPPGTAVSHKLHFFYRSAFDHSFGGYRTVLNSRALVYVIALLNSLVIDFIVRRKVASSVTKSVIGTLPVADIPLEGGPGFEVVQLSARLICRAPEFAELAEVLNVECGPLVPDEERKLRADLDARVAFLYGLDRKQLELILADFRQSESAESSPVRPDEGYKDLVRQYFAALAE
ncbi:Methyltransferase domain-containing protein [Micromonospora haikouensis]|uniref:site-specific DNA-methyltransferase (adenine-specific) n=1 Tax=Micromonospora haikouensis TaxID=686309 RepID=A0A1C4YHS9_9ACTN|nr:N-6 DNA methylase [Micromonospora haikouensis]SCF20283.1 Methyltransferase domain-containing protein [Micromonospora haikouensis]